MLKIEPQAIDAEVNPLTVEEQALLAKLQELAAVGCEEIPSELITLIDQTIKWSYDDPASVNRALYFMAHDPFYQREVSIINAELAAAEASQRRAADGRSER